MTTCYEILTLWNLLAGYWREAQEEVRHLNDFVDTIGSYRW